MKFSLVDFDDWSKVATFEYLEDGITFELTAKIDVEAFVNEEYYLTDIKLVDSDFDGEVQFFPELMKDEQLNDMMDEFESKYQKFLNGGEY